MSSRHKARALALRSLYTMDFYETLYKDTVNPDMFPAMSEKELEDLTDDCRLYVQYLVQGTLQNLENIDQIIGKYSSNRTLDKIETVDRNILRMSIFMMLFQKTLNATVIIDEAVKLSQEYSSPINYKFINGILDTIRKQEL